MRLLDFKITATLGLAFLFTWVSPAFADLKLNGMAMHTNLGQDQFLAAVYCENPTNDARKLLLDSGDKAMELRIVADQLLPRRFKRMWIESMAINSSPAELEKQAQNMAEFSNLLKVKLRAGDIMRVERVNNKVTVKVDNQVVGSIADPAFFDMLLRAWVGPVPLATSFKQSLLAGGNVGSDTRAKFAAITPSTQRVKSIASALLAASLISKDSDKDAADENKAPEKSKEPEPKKEVAAKKEPTKPKEEPAKKPVKVATTPPPKTPAAKTTSKEKKTVDVAMATPGLLKEDDLFKEESILDEDEGEVLTAEALLNQQLYISKLARWTSGFVEYPRRALRSQQEGTVRLMVSINRAGKVVDVRYEEESNHKTLNNAALDAVKKASPYPSMPSSITGETFAFTVPVVFKLQ